MNLLFLIAVIIYVACFSFMISCLLIQPNFGRCPKCGSKLMEFGVTNDGHLVGCTKCDWDETKILKRAKK